jgi:hypothetical protein
LFKAATMFCIGFAFLEAVAPGTATPAGAHPSLTVIDTLSKILIALIGGAWTWLTAIKGRTFKSRLELNTSGKVFAVNQVHYLAVDVSIKNVGSSKAPITQEGTWLRVFCAQGAPRSDRVTRVATNRLGTFRVFANHEWIEPGEQIKDVVLVQFPKNENDLALILSLRVRSQQWRWPPLSQPEDSEDQLRAQPNWEDQFRKFVIWNHNHVVHFSDPANSEEVDNMLC